MKYSLMSFMVRSELRQEKVTFMAVGGLLMRAGIHEFPETADEAYRMLNERGIPAKNGTATFEDMVRFAKENGFDGLDMMSYQIEQDPKEMKAILEKYDLPLTAVNIIAQFSSAETEEDYQKVLANTKAEIDQAGEAGAKQILLVPGGYSPRSTLTREQTFQRMVRGLRDCIAYAEPKGIVISTETLESIGVPWSSYADMERVFAHTPGLAYTHDTGNPLVSLEDPHYLLQEFKDNVVTVHCKDLDYTTEDDERLFLCPSGKILHNVELGTGLVDYKAHLRTLRDMNYDGYIVLEGGRKAENKWQEAVEVLKYFKAMEAEL